MDSFTQIVLGASVGEAVLGRKIGNKAVLYGAIAGTIPDLDVFVSHFTDTVTALEIHRGFTHSILFSALFSVIFSWLVTRYEAYKNFKAWSLFFFLVFVTHPILDSFTTWGTQLFWPIDLRLAFKSIFVIDPLYTFPFLVFLVLAMFQKKTSNKRRTFNHLGLIISTSYLVLSLLIKRIAYKSFEKALLDQNMSYIKIDTRPSPLNIILWNANVETDKAFLLASYSFFDTQSISFESYPKNHDLLGELAQREKVRRMIEISKGWFTITEKNGQLYFNDLRFGLLSMKPNAQDFVFQYKIDFDNHEHVKFTEIKKSKEDAKNILRDLWRRVQGD